MPQICVAAMASMPVDVVEHLITFVPVTESWPVIIGRFVLRVGKALGELATPVFSRYDVLIEEEDLLYFF